jgi:hypothetical protein
VTVHAGGKNGFINDAELVFLSKRNSADYHDYMGSKRFETWFQNQLLPNIRPGSVIVMDNAAYHSHSHWANYCKYVEHMEQEMWMADNLKDDVRPLIVQLADSFSSSSTIGSVSYDGDSQDSVDMTGVEPLHYAGTLVDSLAYAHSKVRWGYEINLAILIT